MRRRLLKILSVTLFFASCCVSGCGKRVVLVPPGEPVRLARPTKTTIYVKTQNGWEKSSNEVTLPEGWYALAVPDNE